MPARPASAGDLSGRIALVTGGTRGIGRGIAIAMSAAGAKVVISGRGAAHGQEVVAEMEKHAGGSFISADLFDDKAVDALVPDVVARFGGLDILVNNAGIDADHPILTHPLDDWRKVIRFNLEVPFRLSQAAARHFVGKGKGAIVNIASIYSLVSAAEAGSYAASKHGLVGLTKTMAIELAAKGVRVNAIAPGLVQTDMTESIWAKPGFDIKSRMPIGRIGTPEDIAGAAVFLASDAADFIHGQVLTIDGGRLTR